MGEWSNGESNGGLTMGKWWFDSWDLVWEYGG